MRAVFSKHIVIVTFSCRVHVGSNSWLQDDSLMTNHHFYFFILVYLGFSFDQPDPWVLFWNQNPLESKTKRSLIKNVNIPMKCYLPRSSTNPRYSQRYFVLLSLLVQPCNFLVLFQNKYRKDQHTQREIKVIKWRINEKFNNLWKIQ